jgi:hypothetical protein
MEEGPAAGFAPGRPLREGVRGEDLQQEGREEGVVEWPEAHQLLGHLVWREEAVNSLVLAVTAIPYGPRRRRSRLGRREHTSAWVPGMTQLIGES